MQKFVKITVLSLFFIFFAPLQNLKAQCHPSPDLSTMNSNFLDFLAQQNKSSAKKISILPFYDNSVKGPDNTLYYGIPFFIYDNFNDAQKDFIHPYISLAATNSESLSGEQLYTSSGAKKIADKLKSDFVIFGSFQRTGENNIRVLVNVFNAKTNSMLSPAEEFSATANDSFFDLLKSKVSSALSRANAGNLKNQASASPSMDYFRYWSKGLELAQNYNYTNLELASLWFEKALKESFQKYEDAALHLARTYFMMALIQKSQKNDFSTNWKRGLETLSYIKNSGKNLSPKYLLTLRYVQAHELSLKAGTSYMANDLKGANSLSLQALKILPEDGILQNLYLVTSQGKGDNGVKINNPICF